MRRSATRRRRWRGPGRHRAHPVAPPARARPARDHPTTTMSPVRLFHLTGNRAANRAELQTEVWGRTAWKVHVARILWRPHAGDAEHHPPLRRDVHRGCTRRPVTQSRLGAALAPPRRLWSSWPSDSTAFSVSVPPRHRARSHGRAELAVDAGTMPSGRPSPERAVRRVLVVLGLGFWYNPPPGRSVFSHCLRCSGSGDSSWSRCPRIRRVSWRDRAGVNHYGQGAGVRESCRLPVAAARGAHTSSATRPPGWDRRWADAGATRRRDRSVPAPYDSNEWGTVVSRDVEGVPSPGTRCAILGDAHAPFIITGGGQPVRHQLRLDRRCRRDSCRPLRPVRSSWGGLGVIPAPVRRGRAAALDQRSHLAIAASAERRITKPGASPSKCARPPNGWSSSTPISTRG